MRSDDSPSQRRSHKSTTDGEYEPEDRQKRRRRDRGEQDGVRTDQRDSSRSRSHRDRSRSPHARRMPPRDRRDDDRDHRPDRSSDKRPRRDGSSGEDSETARRRRGHHRVTEGGGGKTGERRSRRSEKGNAPSSQSAVKRSGPLPSQADSFALVQTGDGDGSDINKPKEQPNFGNSGLLAAASNSVAQADGSTITLKYHEPPEARKPPSKDQWKLFVFKGEQIVDTVELSLRSCWLVGRETVVADLPAEHPSISKQHAVIQFRYTEKRNEFGDKLGRVKPYLIDLQSANGTMLNQDKVPESRYLELRDKDMIQFGSSTREYVLMLAPKS